MTCLITLRHQNRQWDLELPTEVPASRLIEMLIEALQLSASEDLHLSVEPFGAVVGAEQSLAAADIRDGSILLLSSGPQQNSRTVTDAVGDSPARWKPLQEAPEPAPAAEPPKPGYQWKKLDD